jgi:hypothetical protein
VNDAPVAYHTLGAFQTPEGVIIPDDTTLPATPGVTGFPGMVSVQFKGRAYALPDQHVRPIYPESVGLPA